MTHELSHYHTPESDAANEVDYGRATNALGQAALEYSEALEKQIVNEIWYSDAVVIDTYDAAAVLSTEQVVESLETNHAVKAAPDFAKQIGDSQRTNMVTATKDRSGNIRTLSEHEAIDELNAFFDAAEQTSLRLHTISYDGSDIEKPVSSYSKALREKLTFIGDKEYQEAADGIAAYWKAYLDKSSDKYLYIATRWIETHNISHEARKVKSDDYVLDSVLQRFSDEELEKYHSQLLFHEDEIADKDPKDVRVVFLDDWIISGEQLVSAASMFTNKHPEFARSTEIQLIAALETRLKNGLVGQNFGMDGSSLAPSLPIRAYYVAHHDKTVGHGQVRITGAHSSVDYNFNDALSFISSVAEDAIESGNQDQEVVTLATMPVLGDVERPYRQSGFKLTQRARLDKLRNKEA